MVTRLTYKCKSTLQCYFLIKLGCHGIATVGWNLQTDSMMILGQTSTGATQWLNAAGQRIERSLRLRPQQWIWGVESSEFVAKRLWVDAELDDAERLIFLRAQFQNVCLDTLDYEVIKRDVGREWLHVYVLKTPLKISATAVETTYHALERGLRMLYKFTGVMRCLCIHETFVSLSVHKDGALFYFAEERCHAPQQFLYGLRRLQNHYHALDPLIDECNFLLDFTGRAAGTWGKLEYDSTTIMVEPDYLENLIAYGLACRGLSDD